MSLNFIFLRAQCCFFLVSMPTTYYNYCIWGNSAPCWFGACCTSSLAPNLKANEVLVE